MTITQREIEKRIADSYEKTNYVVSSINNPLVSVVTYAFQHEPYIKDCVEGVLMQETTFQVEYIIGEDFSTDGTREIIFDYAQKYPNKIRVVTAGYNVGMKANEWRCMRVSRGEYLAICEGDDYWTERSKLQKQVEAMQRNPECDLSFHPAILRNFDRSTPDKIICRHSKNEKIFSINEVIIGGGGWIPTASIVVKSKIYDYYPDWAIKVPVGDLLLQAFGSLGGGALYLPQVMSVYRKNVPGSWSDKNKNIQFAIEHAKKINEYYDLLSVYLAKKNMSKIIYKKMFLNNYFTAILLLRKIHLVESLNFAKIAFKYISKYFFK